MTELSLSEGVFLRLIFFLIVNLLKSNNHVPNVSFRMATKQETIHCCQWFKMCVCATNGLLLVGLLWFCLKQGSQFVTTIKMQKKNLLLLETGQILIGEKSMECDCLNFRNYK